MKRLVPIATLVVLLMATWCSPVAAKPPGSSRVTLVLVPNLRWQDIAPTSTPTLFRLAGSGAIGDINARSRTRLQGIAASPLEGALTISAGAWASPVDGSLAGVAPAAYSIDERYEGGTAAEGYRRIMGQGVGNAAVAFLGLPMTQRFNDQLSFEVVLGTLGQAIEDAGGTTAAVGNSDAGAPPGRVYERARPAAVAAMDTEGLVRYGDVSARMLAEDPNAPYGVTTNIDGMRAALDEIRRRLQGTAKPHLTVIDPGDTYRAARIAPVVSDSVAETHRSRALQVADEVVATAENALPDDGILIVASQIPGTDTNSIEGLGPIIVSGDGWSGYLTSSSTHRKGIVTNLDVTATVLDVLGIERPLNVVGNPMEPTGASTPLGERVSFLERLNATAVAIEDAKTPIINAMILGTTLILFVSTLVLLRIKQWSARTARRWSLSLRSLMLLVLAIPPASWLMFALVRWPSTKGQVQLIFVVVTAVLVGIALWLQSRKALRLPIAFLSLLTALVVLVEQWFGAPLSYNSFFGYSPLLGARFYGMGNEAAAALLGSSLVGLAYLFDQWPDSRFTLVGRRWGLPVFALLAVGTAAAPFLGANVGMLAWGLVGFGLAWAQMNGHRLTWRTVLLGLVVLAVLLAAFSFIDLFGGGEQTHLGRALASAEQGGLSQLWTILQRKAQTNLRVLTRTNWVLVLVGVLAFLGFMRWRPHGDFAAILAENPHYAAAMSACLVACVVAFFTEDSGIVIPAIMLIWVGVGILYLMLAEWPRSEGQADSRRDESAAESADAAGASA